MNNPREVIARAQDPSAWEAGATFAGEASRKRCYARADAILLALADEHIALVHLPPGKTYMLADLPSNRSLSVTFDQGPAKTKGSGNA